MSGAVITTERIGGTVVWTLARPEVKNALNVELLTTLARAVEEAARDPELRCAVLSSQGDTFCAGGDLRELRDKDTPEGIEPFARAGEALCRALESLPVPVLAALPGSAYGGGAELALACDLRVADPRARLSFKQARMGVTTAWGTIPRLVRTVGHGTAARLLFTAEEVTAEAARALGLVNAVSAEGGALHAALAWAEAIEAGAAGAIRSMEGRVGGAHGQPERLGEEERARFMETWTSDEHREAFAAYFERRPPRWAQGRSRSGS